MSENPHEVEARRRIEPYKWSRIVYDVYDHKATVYAVNDYDVITLLMTPLEQIAKLEAENTLLKSQAAIDSKFYALTVRERDYERVRVDHLQSIIEDVRTKVEERRATLCNETQSDVQEASIRVEELEFALSLLPPPSTQKETANE